MPPTTHRSPRLFVEHDLDGGNLTLDERAAHYLKQVLRLKRGDALDVFNGRGMERAASVESLERHGGVLALADTRAPLPESPLDLTLLQALPKSDAMDLIVQKATELGVRAVVPVYTEFSVVKLDATRSERRLDHWRRISQSACEQCGRHRPPRIAPPAALADALESLPAGALRLALDPKAAQPFGARPRPTHGLVAAVGPEGGFGPTDWLRLDTAAFARASLGPRVLRVETAALAVCALAQASWGDLGGQ
jgi:16S rRNA (uracil1498-N3)-methyltransferase